MINKGIWKILAISVVLAILTSSVAVFSAANLGEGIGEERIDEGGGEGVISLVPPPFIGIAGASATEVSSMREGTNFLEEEAGISAYVNVGYEIDLEEAKTAFKSIETVNESYIIGEIDLPGLPESVDSHAYVHKDGWIVAYYSKYAPASKIMEWYKYDGGEITTTTLADAIHQICDEIEVNYAVIKGNIKYYDFEYPNANRMMLIIDTVYGNNYQWDFFNLEIPIYCWMYEGSWSHYFSGKLSRLYPNGYSRLKIGGDTLSSIGSYDGTYFNYGKYTSSQIEAGVLHEVKIEHNTKANYYGTTGVATVLIYRTS